MRPLAVNDFDAWSEVRRRNAEWLTVWEPSRLAHQPDPTNDKSAFASRCLQRDRDRTAGTAYQFGMFVDRRVAGEVNLNNVIRGAMQSCTVGYWIDRDHAGRGYTVEGVSLVMQFAFEQLGLHRVEVCIVPRNHRSRRVMDKLGIRSEGTAQRYLEINGTWEDHVRYGITSEEWEARRAEIVAAWITA
ncbi:GNAT family N-acetyltransferase [Ilumatobacter sp.]|uniref:GNAT family N-acetyltransferase n=1 Tax=Ilumatobacter sp. TaxID=1967498 RepID=UPI003B51D9E2